MEYYSKNDFNSFHYHYTAIGNQSPVERALLSVTEQATANSSDAMELSGKYLLVIHTYESRERTPAISFNLDYWSKLSFLPYIDESSECF